MKCEPDRQRPIITPALKNRKDYRSVASGQWLAQPPPCRADHSREKLPIVFEDEPPMNANRPEYRWTSLGATTLWDEAHPGTRASRPHNTGKASPISSTRVDRQRRRDAASAGPLRFPPAGWPVAPSRGNRASRNVGACGRDARAPGWAPLPIALAPRGSTRRLAGPQTVSMRQRRPASWPFVVLRVTSWITLFLLFQISTAPALVCGSFEEETADRNLRRTTNGHE